MTPCQVVFSFSVVCPGDVLRCLEKNKAPAFAEALFETGAELRCACLGRRINADLEPRAVLVLELHNAVDESVDREVSSQADIAAGMPLGAALTDDDVAGNDFLATELLDAAVLRIRIASVSR